MQSGSCTGRCTTCAAGRSWPCFVTYTISNAILECGSAAGNHSRFWSLKIQGLQTGHSRQAAAS